MPCFSQANGILLVVIGDRGDLFDASTSRGLKLFHTVSCDWPADDELVISILIDRTPPFFGFLVGSASFELTQASRRLHYPDSRDQKQERREPLPFTGDDAASPPLASDVVMEGDLQQPLWRLCFKAPPAGRLCHVGCRANRR